MDNWVYPALERLADLGYIPSQELGIRPWTRRECLRQANEAKQLLQAAEAANSAVKTPSIRMEAMRLALDLENGLREIPTMDTAAVASIYARYGVIAGPALTDSFFFGQTWWNDYGRPLGRGSSALVGFSSFATRGRYFLDLRGEEQRDPGHIALTPRLAALETGLLYVPAGVPPITAQPAQPAYDRWRPLSLSAGAVFAGNALSFGKQELYWGPGVMGPMSFSRNAEPTYNLNFGSVHPHPLPLISSVGTYSFDLVFGKLSGHKYPARPYFNGAKLTLNIENTLELGFTRWSVLWGQGHPMTPGSLKNNLFSANSTGTGLYGDRLDPGDRKSDFDFVLHPPGLRQYLTLYAEAYADDEPTPIDAPRRAAWAPGIYFPQLPFLPHNDLRVEVVSTEEMAKDEGGGRFFTNNNYLDANTNKGFLLGTAAGRDARAIEARLGWWSSARTHIEAGYRQTKGSHLFLPGGSTITDGFVNANWALRQEKDVLLEVFLQQERFWVPSFDGAPQHNTSARIQITWFPKDLWCRTGSINTCSR